MLIVLGNAGAAEFTGKEGCITYWGFEIKWDLDTIGIESKEDRILEITKKGRIYYNVETDFNLEKKLDFIKLKKDGKEVIEISFSNCDVKIMIYDIFIVELQNFLKDGWEIELI